MLLRGHGYKTKENLLALVVHAALLGGSPQKWMLVLGRDRRLFWTKVPKQEGNMIFKTGIGDLSSFLYQTVRSSLSMLMLYKCQD